MARSVSLILLSLLLLPSAAPAQTQSDFYNDTALQDIRLTMLPTDWTRLKVNFVDNTYYPASFNWKGVTLDAQIKQHGQGTRSPVKPSLKVDFNRDDPSGNFLGLSAVILRANTQETSLMSESVAMKLYAQLNIAAPREAPARLFVNNEYIGVYHAVESIDKVFIKQRYGEDTGYLYEAQRAGGTPFVYQNLGNDPASYGVYFDPKTHETSPDFATIMAFVQAINQLPDSSFVSGIAQYIDVKKLLNYLTVETYLADTDSFLSDPGMNNYFFYRYANSKLFEYSAWDRSACFLGNGSTSTAYTATLNRQVMRNTDVNTLTKRAFAFPDFKNAWLQGLSQVATFAGGAGGWLEQEIDRQFNIIKDAVLADPNKQCPDASGALAPCSNDQFLAAVAAMKTFAQQRQGIVRSQLASLGVVQPPQVTSAGLVNAATFNASPNNQVARGQLISLFGANLVSGGPFPATNVPLPTILGGTSVKVNDTAIPLILVTSGQVNAQLPFELSDTGTATLTVVSGTQSSSPATVNLQATSPGIFTLNSQGSADGAILHADNSLVTTANPAKAGETVVIFCTGLGATTPPVASGKAASGEKVNAATTVSIGGKDAPVAFAGLAPGFVGLYQVNAVVPAGVTGSSKIVITSAGNASRSDVTLPVQ